MPLCFSGGICEGGKVRIGVTSLNLNIELNSVVIDFIAFCSLCVFGMYTLKYTKNEDT